MLLTFGASVRGVATFPQPNRNLEGLDSPRSRVRQCLHERRQLNHSLTGPVESLASHQ